jgi:glyoxylase-like metal-dependent hydrolase (beta-lactamase superfamily II)
MINAFLIVNSLGCILVDTGLPNTENKIQKTLEKLNLSFTDINLIVITHAHIDHAGNAAKLKALSGAPVVAHEGDLPYLQGVKKMHFCSTGWFGRLFKKTGAIQKPYLPIEPDILMTAITVFNLNDYGIQGEIRVTAGHTEGSISVVVDNNKAVVGDLISSGILLGGIAKKNKAKRPPFEDDAQRVSQMLTSLAFDGVEEFYMGHGGPLPRAEVFRHASSLNRLTKLNG